MTGTASDPGDELLVLAGEYVLGTLPYDEADRLVREAEGDPVLTGAIGLWERWLTPLGLVVLPVAPPGMLWPRIEASLRIGTGPAMVPMQGERGRDAVSRGNAPEGVALRSVARWRAATAVGFLLAAGIAGVAILDRPQAPAPVAVLSPLGASRAAFVIEMRHDGALDIVPMAPTPVPAGHDLELWSLAAGETVPRPMGVLPLSGIRLAADHVPAGGGRILVSLEPKGGSPTRLPTGPVLYGTALPNPAL